MSLTERFQPRNNSLNALRLVLAALVVVSHAWPLTGVEPEPAFGGANLGSWAVFGFFAISGFLITRSRLRARRTRDYYRARALRILPAFVVALVVVAFVFAPLSVLVDPGASWNPFSSLTYVLRNLPLYAPIVWQPGIEHTLVNAAYPVDWDGPLWTLFWEALCYVAIGVLVSVLPRKAVPGVLIGLFVVLTAASLALTLGVVHMNDLIGRAIPMILAFIAGALLLLFGDRVRIAPVWIIAAVVLLALTIVAGLGPSLGTLPLALLLLWLGVVLPLQKVGSRYDISYGVYIYAWPVQQFVTLVAGPDLFIPLDLLIVMAITVPLAFLSCILIERPALARKAPAGAESPQEAPFP
ncbi:MAG: acyltransferase family protein [Microbacteriaceae bacterium]